ncbi:rhodanese-like domain-containing protein [Xanthobacter versatilis]|uniref:hypothetical protein n=1 Tax=Xanthobacter autotrophicus (strain ATCC BAA-1158 / Py2) TaxID=78245 RepID=UPI00372C40CA
MSRHGESRPLAGQPLTHGPQPAPRAPGPEGAGLPLEAGDTGLLHTADDVRRSPYQQVGDRHAAFRRYLDWEIALSRQIDRDDTVAFKLLP